ncbi:MULTISPECIES: helix-turn-helix domain-containing protein [Streptomyces]|uniref:DNA-binding protein n=2 Tax=Streptomyces TaxID=1883 RepID=A0A0W7WWJ9_9ACTN|nr:MULTISPECIES: helix-turn-helix transcriptional regulator [Streptomyces]KUF14824.1 DNA-binding protein [Streptomyces silvensis]MVO84543.1 helix-turn-helix domain-containing protein [Streptomyces typhae]
MRADQFWNSGTVHSLIADLDPGGLIRIGRQGLGWRQADLGARIGCSASTVSRLEQCGRHADLTLLRHAAKEVGVPTNVLVASLGLTGPQRSKVAPEWPHCAEEDRMRRRTLLAVAGLAAPAALLTGVEDAFASMPDPTGSPVPLDRRLAQARVLFDGGKNTELLKRMPSLLADAHHATRSREEAALARLSATYSLASQVLTKLGHYEQSRLAADRATLYAEWSNSPIVAAAAAREMSIVLRHLDQPAAAERHIHDAVSAIEATGLTTDAQAAAYAQMLCTTSYTAARAGDRDQAASMIREARRAARDLPSLAPAGRLFPITPASVRLYTVGVHWALADPGAAMEAGRGLHAGQFTTAERQCRVHTDLGRVQWMAGKPEQAARSFLAAARISVGEIRDRPSIRKTVAEIHRRHPRVTGVRELATVAGIAA